MAPPGVECSHVAFDLAEYSLFGVAVTIQVLLLQHVLCALGTRRPSGCTLFTNRAVSCMSVNEMPFDILWSLHQKQEAV
jgi:hypothetical protein